MMTGCCERWFYHVTITYTVNLLFFESESISRRLPRLLMAAPNTVSVPLETTARSELRLSLCLEMTASCSFQCIHVHRFVTVPYFVEIVRRHSHPHSWVLNTPIFAIWILDKLLCLIWRQVKSPSVIRQTISNDYMVLYWTVNKISEYNDITAVGSNFLMNVYLSLHGWSLPTLSPLSRIV